MLDECPPAHFAVVYFMGIKYVFVHLLADTAASIRRYAVWVFAAQI